METLVNREILANHKVKTDLMSFDEAKRVNAVALFGEKYDDTVRVLSVGTFSKELCGGTHVHQTGDIGLFKIISEAGIASGVRRIEIVSGMYALDYIHDKERILHVLSEQLKSPVHLLPQKMQQWMDNYKSLEKNLQQFEKMKASMDAELALQSADKIGDTTVLVYSTDASMKELRDMMDATRARLNTPHAILYIGKEHANMNVMVAISSTVQSVLGVSADWVKQLCGKGGGRPDLAQGGCALPSDLSKQLNQIETNWRDALKK